MNALFLVSLFLLSPSHAQTSSRWSDLFTAVLAHGKVYSNPKDNHLVAVGVEQVDPPSVQRIVLIGVPTRSGDEDVLNIMGVGVCVEKWSLSTTETGQWTVDRWLFSASPEGKLERVSHESLIYASKEKILSRSSLLGHPDTTILPNEQTLFDSNVHSWLDYFKIGT